MYTTVLTYGTFDLFHYGHSNVLKNASKLGSRLIVGVSSDQFNKAKGKEAYEPLATRLNNVSKLHFVTKAIVEDSWEQKINDIMPPMEYTTYLKDVFYGKKSDVDNEPLIIPTKKNGEEYRLDELNPEQ